MSTDIKPEDIEAAIAAAEQRRRLRMGEPAAEAKPAASGGMPRQSVLDRSRPVGPDQPSLTAARETLRGAGAGSAADDELDDSWLDQPAKPKSSGSRYADLPETEVVWEPEPARRGLIVPFAIAAIALLAFGGILWWAYGAVDEVGGPLPVITAEQDPVKIKPAEEGGLEVPDQDKLVYDQIAEGETQRQSQVEQLLPGPEEPVAPPQPVAAAPSPSAIPAPLSEPDAETAAAMAVEPAAGGSGDDAQVAPAVPAVEPAETAALPAPQPAQPAEPAASSTPAPAAASPEPAPEPAEVATLPESTAPAAPAPAAPAAGGGKWRIQLASVKSESAAKQEWSRMQQTHPDLLGDMRLTVQRADLGTKGVYFRLQAGPLPNRTTAEDVCAELKSSKQPCIVVKP